MYVRPTAPLPIGGVVDDAIKLYRASFQHCWLIAVFGSLVAGAFGIFLTIYARVSGFSLTGLDALQIYREPPIVALYLLQAVLSLAFYGALIAVQNTVGGATGPLGAGKAIGIGFTRLGRATMAGVIWWVVITLGLILLLVPGIYLLGALCLWPVALYADDASATQSLQTSRELITGHWWRVSTILTIGLVIILVLAIMAGLLAAMLVAVSHRDLASGEIMVQVVSMIANVFVLPMVPAVLMAIYRDLKLRRGGGDLAARAAALRGPSSRP
jgi:hypothetical protein